ncbi:MAG TPA: hypothetical protein VGS57_16540 [Thermoanaerobaculia bacterium]|nr:hypothetical protein [Thermoanaerobaculia bacterium]
MALAGLAAEDLAPATSPTALEEGDLTGAARVIAFSELPPAYRASGGMELWTVPPISEDYERSRSAIVAKVERLLGDLVVTPRT